MGVCMEVFVRVCCDVFPLVYECKLLWVYVAIRSRLVVGVSNNCEKCWMEKASCRFRASSILHLKKAVENPADMNESGAETSSVRHCCLNLKPFTKSNSNVLAVSCCDCSHT